MDPGRDPEDPSDSPFVSLQHWYPRVWDEWARDKDGAIPADIYSEDETSSEITESQVDQKVSITFKALLPKFASMHAFSGEPRCANEISLRLYGPTEPLAAVFPKFAGEKFLRTIAGIPSFRAEWRVGRNGLVRLVEHEGNIARELPTAQDLVFAWLRDLGWKPELSAPGILSKQIYKTLGGNTFGLKNKRVLGLFEHMSGGSVKSDGTPIEANESKLGQERDLSVPEVKSRLAAAAQRGNLYEYLLNKGVFRLGLRVQCPRCSRHSWFSLADVGEDMQCPKCLNVFAALGNINNATWSYKTTGPFSVPNYADGAYAVLLTLDFFSDQSMSTFKTTPVLSFKAEKPGSKEDLEADLALFWEDQIFGEKLNGMMFSECKTFTYFTKNDFKRMRSLAKQFPGAVLVFSTLRESLTRNEIAGITRIAKAGRKYWKTSRPINPVLVLTGNELLATIGIPYCWSDPIKKKFDHTYGILKTCDATQQIYLNLPSWESEWHAKWEKRARRSETKPALGVHGEQPAGIPINKDESG